MTDRAAPAPWRPDWQVPPGEILAEMLAEKRVRSVVFAAEIGLTPNRLRAILTGALDVTDAEADAIAYGLGGTPAFWRALAANARPAG